MRPLRYEPNGTLHDDLILYLGSEEWRCDSYYLAVDEEPATGKVDETMVRSRLCRVLEQWRATIQGLEPGEMAYLPFDYSDQSTRFLRCVRLGDGLEVAAGWTGAEGWRATSGELGTSVDCVPDFTAKGAAVTMAIRELLDAIDESMEALL